MDKLFHDRSDAGKKLSSKLMKYLGEETIVLGIPRGGVPVAYEIARSIDAEALDVIIPRKIPIPWNREAGFGAVTSTGETVLNHEVLKKIHLRPDEIKELSEKVLREVKRRAAVYRGDKPFPMLYGKTVIVVDDGLATGFTMMAAVKSLKKYRPKRIIVAVPLAPRHAIEKVAPYADEVATLFTGETTSFAVASFYEDFSDLTDHEVVHLLEKYGNHKRSKI